jgi:uncharacterized protein (TIGR02271 family)
MVANQEARNLTGTAADDPSAGERVAGAAGGAVKGAGEGALIGGATGLAASLAMMLVPGIGPVLAIGPLAATLGGATLGAMGGGVIGGLTGMGVPDTDAGYYAEGVRRGGTLVAVSAPDDRANEAVAILNRHGAVDVERRGAAYRQAGFTGYSPDAQPYTRQQITEERSRYAALRAAPASAVTSTTTSTTMPPVTGTAATTTNVDRGEQAVIPIVEEQLQVGKREVERGGARVHTRVVETPVQENVQLREEHVTVERHAVDRPVTNADATAFQEGVIEVRETAEEAVVAKQARVVEEVVVGKEATERTETVRDTVRRTEVEVEQIAPEHQPGVSDFSAYETDFRGDFTSRYGASSGATYEQYQPAYRYGYELASTPRYAGGDWASIEPEVRRDWEARYPGSPWERFRDSVRFAWERGRGSGQRVPSGAEGAVGGNQVPGVQTGGRAADGTPDTRGILEKVADAVTGKHVDDKTGKPVR